MSEHVKPMASPKSEGVQTGSTVEVLRNTEANPIQSLSERIDLASKSIKRLSGADISAVELQSLQTAFVGMNEAVCRLITSIDCEVSRFSDPAAKLRN